MAKVSGLTSNLFVGVYDVSGDIGALSSIDTTRATQVVSDITQSAESRLLLRKDGSLAYSAFWDTAAGASHLALSTITSADVITSFAYGATVGNPAASMVGKQVNYAPTFGADGSLVAEVSALANGFGLEWSGGGTGDGMLTTGKQSFATGTVNGTSIDLGSVSTLFGAAGYLHVISVASGTATFAIQDSADDSNFTDITGLIFTGATGATSQRLQTAVGATIRRYVRIQGTGVHGAAVIFCNFIRYLTSSAA